jgi:hypothetical protein
VTDDRLITAKGEKRSVSATDGSEYNNIRNVVEQRKALARRVSAMDGSEYKKHQECFSLTSSMMFAFGSLSCAKRLSCRFVNIGANKKKRA